MQQGGADPAVPEFGKDGKCQQTDSVLLTIPFRGSEPGKFPAGDRRKFLYTVFRKDSGLIHDCPGIRAERFTVQSQSRTEIPEFRFSDLKAHEKILS